jgi:tripartite-type tricarboxylate transporter receptor subunit TctC
MQKTKIFASLLIMAATTAGHAAQGDTYPDKPIRLVVTFSPGGSVDILARTLGPKLGELLGQPVVVENRAGASGIIGTDYVAKSKPDGYTVMLHTIPFVANQHLYKSLPYDTSADFTPVSLIAASPSVLVVNPTLPVKSVKELIELAKASPGKINYATAGAGTNPHISGELFNNLAGINLTPIHYKGGGPALTAVWGGEVPVMFTNVSESAPLIKAEKLRPLAVSGSARNKLYPDLPTVAEAGVPGYDFSTWHGLLAPKGTPDAVIAKLNETVIAALRTPEVAQRLDAMGLEVIGSSPAQFAQHLSSESDKWAKVIKERNIALD